MYGDFLLVEYQNVYKEYKNRFVKCIISNINDSVV